MMTDNCSKLIEKIKEQDIYDHQGVINSPQGVTVTARNGKKILQFSANNYLGLANHPRLNNAAKEAIDNYGFGMAT
jgi:glycine C-acetyltransferase